MNHIKLIPTFQRKKSIPKQLKDLELFPLNEQFSKLTMPIISDDDMRPAMMGNFFDMESKKIVSTDAHKLTAINMPDGTFNFIKQTYKKELNENPKGLIFHTLKQMQNDYNELVKLGTKNNNSNDLQPFDEYVKFREIEDGKYPNYEAVIPKEFTNEINVDYQKLYWYAKVLLDAKIINDATKINSSNENEYQNKKIEYLKDSYVPFLSSAKQIIFTYTLDGKKEFIGFDAKFLCDILKFAMEYKGKTFGKVGLSGNSRAMVIEFENGLYSPSDSIGLIMPVMIMNNDEYTIGQVDYDFNVKMYYDLDTNSINSDGVNYPIDSVIGYVPSKDSLSTPNIRVEQQVSKIENNSMTFITNRIKGLKIALKVARAENKPKIQKRILGLEIAKKMQPKKMNNGGSKLGDEIKDVSFIWRTTPSLVKIIKIKKTAKGGYSGLFSYPDEDRTKWERLDKYMGYNIWNENTMQQRTNKIENQKTNNTNTYEDLLEQDRDLQNEIDEEKRKPKNEQSELKRLALEREVILRKIDEMEQFNNGGGVESSLDYKIIEGYDHYNNYPLYQVVGKDNHYIGEYHTDIKDAKKELKEFENEKFNKGGVVFTNYNGSEIMYEPNYDEYFVNDEVFKSMEDAKKYIDSGEMQNDSYADGGGVENDKTKYNYEFDINSNSFWIDDRNKPSGQISFETKKEMDEYIKNNPNERLQDYDDYDDYKKGGNVGNENYEMLKNKTIELLHHSKELQAVVKKKPKTPAWVISKSSRASTDLSDITHYLEGKL